MGSFVTKESFEQGAWMKKIDLFELRRMLKDRPTWVMFCALGMRVYDAKTGDEIGCIEFETPSAYNIDYDVNITLYEYQMFVESCSIHVSGAQPNMMRSCTIELRCRMPHPAVDKDAVYSGRGSAKITINFEDMISIYNPFIRMVN